MRGASYSRRGRGKCHRFLRANAGTTFLSAKYVTFPGRFNAQFLPDAKFYSGITGLGVLKLKNWLPPRGIPRPNHCFPNLVCLFPFPGLQRENWFPRRSESRPRTWKSEERSVVFQAYDYLVKIACIGEYTRIAGLLVGLSSQRSETTRVYRELAKWSMKTWKEARQLLGEQENLIVSMNIRVPGIIRV